MQTGMDLEMLPIIARPWPLQRGSIRAGHNQFFPLFLDPVDPRAGGEVDAGRQVEDPRQALRCPGHGEASTKGSDSNLATRMA